MTTLAIALLGSGVSAWLARRARRFAVLDRIRGAEHAWLPRPVRARLALALDDAGITRSPEHVVQLWLLAALLCGVLGAVLGIAIGLLAGATVLGGGPVVLRISRRRQQHAVAAAVPELLDGVAAELRAGGTVATALTGPSPVAGALTADLDRVRARVELGATIPEALHQWARERTAPGTTSAAGACTVAHEVGGRCADALDGLAASLRARLAVLAETRALSSQARYSALVVGLGPLGYLAFSVLLDRRSVDALVGTAAGRMCALAGLGLECAGALWMRRILRAGDIA